ncbi:MAG: sugar phosphate isomerase/epimerase family protein [Acidobacteriota bacterium]|nr:sugar phosphate isomerase/epimerase family protein [Acidobacteriota bacterium]
MSGRDRRRFISQAGLAGLGLLGARVSRGQQPAFRISLAEWSLHRTLFAGELDHLDFARTSRELGIDGVEYVNQFFKDRAEDRAYLEEMKRRCDGEGVQSLILMVDNEGRLGAPDRKEQAEAVANHRKWIEAGRFLGCHAVRVNAHSEGSFSEQQNRVADGLRELAEVGAELGVDVIVENHGGLSSHGRWLAGVMQKVDHPSCGTLPDFGNFGDYGGYDFSRGVEAYDRYLGVADLMPWARGVSAKSHTFGADGEETRIDFRRMMRVVLDAGYSEWVGIEYGGGPHPELEGIRLTKLLLERVRSERS